MCLAIPGKIIDVSFTDDVKMGRADFGGVVKLICLQYTPHAEPGDYVLVHVGFALNKIDETEAERTYRALKNLQQLDELDIPQLHLEAVKLREERENEIS